VTLLLNYANLHDDPVTAGLVLDTAARTGMPVETLMAIWNAGWRWFGHTTIEEHRAWFAQACEGARLLHFIKQLDVEELC